MKTWELTEKEKETLSDQDRQKYETAVRYKQHDWACGPWGGWVRGNEILISLGWREHIREENHRRFISLIKPQ